VVTHQLQVERRTGKVRRSKTDVLPTVPRNQPSLLRWEGFVEKGGLEPRAKSEGVMGAPSGDDEKDGLNELVNRDETGEAATDLT